MAKERICIFCGQTYLYCPTCSEYNAYPKWMYNFDKEQCHDLYEVVGGYNMGIKTKEDIKAVLDKYNITDYSQFSAGLRKILNDLFPKVNKKAEKKDQEIVENSENTDYFSRKRGRFMKKDYNDEAITEE